MFSLSRWIFTMNIFGPYATVMLINKFKYNYAVLGLLSIISLLTSAIFQPIFGKLGDKYGRLKILRFTLTIQTLLNVGWIFAIPTLYYMIPFQLSLGIMGAGVGLISSNLLMEIVPTFVKQKHLLFIRALQVLRRLLEIHFLGSCTLFFQERILNF